MSSGGRSSRAMRLRKAKTDDACRKRRHGARAIRLLQALPGSCAGPFKPFKRRKDKRTYEQSKRAQIQAQKQKRRLYFLRRIAAARHRLSGLACFDQSCTKNQQKNDFFVEIKWPMCHNGFRLFVKAASKRCRTKGAAKRSPTTKL